MSERAEKINLLFVIPSLRLGGAERLVINLVNGLSRDRFKIHLFTFEQNLDQLEDVDKENVLFYNYPRRYKTDFRPSIKLAEIIDREKIDIVHATLQISIFYAFIGLMLAKRKVRFIGAIHTTINRNLKYELFDRLLYIPMMRRCDKIIASCNNQKDFLLNKYPTFKNKLITIYNGIDTNKFVDNFEEPNKKETLSLLGLTDDDFIVGMVAGFRPEKGHEYALRAIKMLISRGKKVKLILIGDGERKKQLQKLALELGIMDSVVWMGFQNDPRKFISIFDVLLMASFAVETFSMAILEILAMNKAVIATDMGGTSEAVINGKNGFIIKPKDPDDIADKINLLMENPILLNQFSHNARKSVVERFDIQQMVNSTEFFLLNLELYRTE